MILQNFRSTTSLRDLHFVLFLIGTRGRRISGEMAVADGQVVVFRCSDIGKYKLNGAGNVTCQVGILSARYAQGSARYDYSMYLQMT